LSLKKNIVANYTSQLFIVIISLVTLPKLIKVMGAEAYGLVGFFSLMQSWLMLLDLGMSPTLTREIARFKGGVLDAYNLVQFFRAIKKIFIVLAILITILILFASNFIVTSWLKTETISHDILINSVILMAFILAIRWISSIYRAVIVGFEKLVWLGIFNVFFSVLRFVTIFFVLVFISHSPIVFFGYQLVVSVLELIWLSLFVKRLLPIQVKSEEQIQRPLKEVMSFSLTIAFTSAVWVIITQTDKLILSNLLKLSDYGYYSLAVQIAGVITLISGPISSAILPRLTTLEAEGKDDELISLYRSSTRLIVIISGTVSLILIFFANKVIFMWTGNLVMVEKVSKYVFLYAIGNFFLAVAAFPYYLQYAKGNLRFHLLGNIVFLLFLIPSLIIVVNKFGGIGAGYVWIGVNAIYLFGWVPIINNYFVMGLNKKWYFDDILRISLPACLVAFVLSYFMPLTTNRLFMFIQLAFAGLIILLSCLITSGKWKEMLYKFKQ
jgi:O-antigen/teichoic acid export membrane protein